MPSYSGAHITEEDVRMAQSKLETCICGGKVTLTWHNHPGKPTCWIVCAGTGKQKCYNGCRYIYTLPADAVEMWNKEQK